jgi:hypothetical protein
MPYTCNFRVRGIYNLNRNGQGNKMYVDEVPNLGQNSADTVREVLFPVHRNYADTAVDELALGPTIRRGQNTAFTNHIRRHEELGQDGVLVVFWPRGRTHTCYMAGADSTAMIDKANACAQADDTGTALMYLDALLSHKRSEDLRGHHFARLLDMCAALGDEATHMACRILSQIHTLMMRDCHECAHAQLGAKILTQTVADSVVNVCELLGTQHFKHCLFKFVSEFPLPLIATPLLRLCCDATIRATAPELEPILISRVFGVKIPYSRTPIPETTISDSDSDSAKVHTELFEELVISVILCDSLSVYVRPVADKICRHQEGIEKLISCLDTIRHSYRNYKNNTTMNLNLCERLIIHTSSRGQHGGAHIESSQGQNGKNVKHYNDTGMSLSHTESGPGRHALHRSLSSSRRQNDGTCIESQQQQNGNLERAVALQLCRAQYSEFLHAIVRTRDRPQLVQRSPILCRCMLACHDTALFRSYFDSVADALIAEDRLLSLSDILCTVVCDYEDEESLQAVLYGLHTRIETVSADKVITLVRHVKECVRKTPYKHLGTSGSFGDNNSAGSVRHVHGICRFYSNNPHRKACDYRHAALVIGVTASILRISPPRLSCTDIFSIIEILCTIRCASPQVLSLLRDLSNIACELYHDVLDAHTSSPAVTSSISSHTHNAASALSRLCAFSDETKCDSRFIDACMESWAQMSSKETCALITAFCGAADTNISDTNHIASSGQTNAGTVATTSAQRSQHSCIPGVRGSFEWRDEARKSGHCLAKLMGMLSVDQLVDIPHVKIPQICGVCRSREIKGSSFKSLMAHIVRIVDTLDSHTKEDIFTSLFDLGPSRLSGWLRNGDCPELRTLAKEYIRILNRQTAVTTPRTDFAMRGVKCPDLPDIQAFLDDSTALEYQKACTRPTARMLADRLRARFQGMVSVMCCPRRGLVLTKDFTLLDQRLMGHQMRNKDTALSFLRAFLAGAPANKVTGTAVGMHAAGSNAHTLVMEVDETMDMDTTSD